MLTNPCFQDLNVVSRPDVISPTVLPSSPKIIPLLRVLIQIRDTGHEPTPPMKTFGYHRCDITHPSEDLLVFVCVVCCRW